MMDFEKSKRLLLEYFQGTPLEKKTKVFEKYNRKRFDSPNALTYIKKCQK